MKVYSKVMILCEDCGKEINAKQFSKHKNSNSCKINQSGAKRNIEVPEDLICRFCGKTCKNKISFIQHERCCPQNIDRDYSNGMTGKTSWAKGLTKENNEMIRDRANTLKSNYDNGLIIPSFLGKKHTKETKDKISKVRVQYLINNPDKVPYLLNHYSKGASYPERYWKGILEKHNINFVSEHRVSLYSLDFAILDKMIDFEIDGEQHYSDGRISDSDLKRNEYLESLGWTVVRVRWSQYQKLNLDERKQFVENIIKILGV